MTNTIGEFFVLRIAAYRIITLVIMLLSFQYFTLSPLAAYTTNIEKGFTVFILLFLLVYLLFKVIQTKTLETIDILVLVMSFGIPLYSAFIAKFYWSQPILHGFTTQKFWYIALGAFVVYYFLRNKYITILDIHHMMLGVAWFSLAIYLLVEVMFDATKFRDTNFVYCNPAKGGCGFKFNTFFLGYAMLYYYIKAIKEKRHFWLLVSGLFFAYFLFFFQKRGVIIITGITFIIILIANTNAKSFIKYISIFLTTFVVMLGSLYLVSQQKFNTLVGQYGNFVDILQGEETGEGSADSRIRELATMAKFSSEHKTAWIFGNGKWSDNWEQNPALIEKFFPSDLGLVGVFFVYGIVGFLLVHIQFYFTTRWLRKNETTTYPIIYQHFKYFLLFYYLRSLFSGSIFFGSGPAITLFFVVLFYYIKKYETDVSVS